MHRKVPLKVCMRTMSSERGTVAAESKRALEKQQFMESAVVRPRGENSESCLLDPDVSAL